MSTPELAIATIPRALNCGHPRGVRASWMLEQRALHVSRVADVSRRDAYLERRPDLIRKRPVPDRHAPLSCTRWVSSLDHEVLDISGKVVSRGDGRTREVRSNQRAPTPSKGSTNLWNRQPSYCPAAHRARKFSAALGTASQKTSILRSPCDVWRVTD